MTFQAPVTYAKVFTIYSRNSQTFGVLIEPEQQQSFCIREAAAKR